MFIFADARVYISPISSETLLLSRQENSVLLKGTQQQTSLGLSFLSIDFSLIQESEWTEVSH